MRIVLCFTILLGGFNLYSQDYYSDRLFIKVKEEYKNSYSLEKDVRFLKIIRKVDMTSIQPVSKHPLLNHTYEVVLRNKQSLDAILLPLNQLEQIDFAEKVPIYQLFFTPNDPLYSTQWNLAKIQADQAWNLSQGCASIKIAVTDDGFLMNHEDLVNQWHINSGEINGNGIDDDGNGYIDDWRGWDAANNDNDPSATAPTNSFFTHGTHVAGIIAGQTHNSKGIAAIGYNCKMIPVKIGLSPNSSLTGAFQGLDYAINASGCDVVNMSWGGGGKSATFQTLFNIAKTKGIICVAAAGNSNSSNDMYPASYNHVISVAASANTDARASFSNYGSTIDVTAPGVGIPSCLAGATNSYGNMSGTSMASPLVAGLCGLMKCYNPLPADSIEACLKRTCDNIAAQNPILKDSLGAGRINAFQALQCLTKKPKSDFIALDTFQCIGKSVRYIAKSFGIPTLTYNWSFPGGSPSTSTIANPVVTYGANGLKSATLITCNSLGCDTITKTNYVSIDTPRAWLTNRKYTSYNSNPVIVTVHFKGNPPFNVTLTDGTNNFTQTNIRSNPYFFSIVPKKDTSLISISSFSDSSCVGKKYGLDTIYRINLNKDASFCVTLKTSDNGAIDGFGFSPTSSTNINWTFTNNENVVANWTAGGTPHFWRNILKFNMSSIPANAIINSASLSLYSKPNAAHGWTGQPTAGTNNSTSISRITNSWTTASISTTAWPSITTQNQVILAQSPNNNHSYTNIDIKNLIQDLITSGDNGIFLRHVDTPYYNSLIFYSAEDTDTSKHPKLVVCYTIPGGGSQYCESSFKFNGTNNNVVKITPQNGAAFKDLYSTNGFTWECWFNLGNRSGANVTSVESAVGATDAQLCEDIGFHFNWPWSGSGKFNWVVSGQTNCSVPRGVVGTNMTFNANTWYHAAGVMNYNTNTMQLYINGNLMNSGTLTIPMSQRMQNSVAVTIGNQDVNYNPYHTLTPFNGKIDEVRFWNSVRTASEIQSSYKSCLPASTSNLVAYFKADEGTGTNTVSLVNGNFVGTLQNAASWDSQVDSVKNCTLCSTSLCRDSTEINSGQTGWQALQTNGTWGTLVSSSYCAGTFTANSSLFPGVSAANCLWGPTVNTGTRTAYNSSSHTTTSTFSGSFPYLKKQFTLPSGSVIDSVILWMISDDYIDSVWVNNKVVYKATNPIHYGQIVMTGAEINLGNSISPLNEVIVKPGDFGGCYGTYFRMKVYYSKVCGNSTSDCDTTNLNTGKVLHLDFNGNTQDKSGNSNHATNFGATPVAGKAGVANTAYKFNGTSDYMEIPHSSSLSPTSAITMTAYAYLDAYNPNGGWYCSNLISKGPDNANGNYNLRITNQNYYIPDTNNSFIYGNYYNNGYDIGSYLSSFKTAPFIQTKKWYCFVYTYDGDSTRMYIDGILKWKYKSSVNSLLTNSQNLRIGRSFNNSPDQYFFNGVLDDIRIYNRALAPSEVKGYCGTCNVPPPLTDCDTNGLVLCMSMDGNANDSTKYAHHGIVRGATPTTNRFGNTNSAYSFNGISNYINLGNKSLLKPNKATISMWVKPNAISTSGFGYSFNPIMVTGNTNSPGHFYEAYFLGISTSGNNKFHVSSWNPSPTISGGGSSVQNFNLNTWHHLTTTIDNDSIKIYINGVLDKAYFKGFATNYSSIDSIIIANSGNSTFHQRFFNGAIDDIKMYNRVLSASEVSNLYTKPFTCSCNAIQPPPCDTSRRYTYNQCLNDSIQVLASAGSKYQWSPVSGLSNDTIRNPKVFVSNNQRYLVSYTSLKNCQLIDTIDVEAKAAAIYPKMEDQLICIGDSVQMMIPVYGTNIVWSPNAAISSTSSKSPYFFPTSPTTYYLEFRDTFGCLQRDTFVVNTKACCPARARFTIPKDLLCFGETLPVSNTSKGPITSYSWNFGSAIPNTFSGANPPSLTFPSGGSYTLRLIVTNGVCFDTMTKTVSIIQINPNAGKDTNNCLAAFTTQLGESPISDWTYKWTPTQYLNDATIADPICSIVNDSINYILEIMDRNSGCKAYDTVVVYTNRTIDSTAQNLRICFGDSVLFNGIYRKTTNNYFYTIKKADGICDSFINLLRLNVLVRQDIPLVPKVRCKFYIDNKGKRYTSSFIERDTIRSKSILNCDSIIYTTPIQIFQTDTSSRNVNGCSPFRYNGKTYLTSKLKADSFIIRGAYSGCDSIIEYIHVTVHPKPKAVITPSIPNPVLYKQTVTLSASGGQTYFWLQTGSNVPEIYYKINDISPKLFTVRVTDENDCWDTVSYLVQGKLPEKCYYGFPNVFSPNEDNLNDEYLPNMDECTEVIIFAIYDRWGEKVFETNQLKGWNGYFKGRPAPMGVYVYFAKLKTPWGIKEHQGSFTLMR